MNLMLLEGMPANAIEKLLLRSQEPSLAERGADIITNRNAKNHLSATYTNSTSFVTMTCAINNSLLLSAKNKYFDGN
jgi:hypothetical protein